MEKAFSRGGKIFLKVLGTLLRSKMSLHEGFFSRGAKIFFKGWKNLFKECENIFKGFSNSFKERNDFALTIFFQGVGKFYSRGVKIFSRGVKIFFKGGENILRILDIILRSEMNLH